MKISLLACLLIIFLAACAPAAPGDPVAMGTPTPTAGPHPVLVSDWLTCSDARVYRWKSEGNSAYYMTIPAQTSLTILESDGTWAMILDYQGSQLWVQVKDLCER